MIEKDFRAYADAIIARLALGPSDTPPSSGIIMIGQQSADLLKSVSRQLDREARKEGAYDDND